MHPSFLGDSYDLVKRFFVQELRAIGYEVAVDPLFTGDWGGEEERFHRLLGARHRQELSNRRDPTALFLDPDTGVTERPTPKHISFSRLAAEAQDFELVFAFDQSFSRQGDPSVHIARKLDALARLGVAAMYYDSHARFVFVSRNGAAINRLALHLDQVGLPARRLIRSGK